jgi:hypothetical protein
VTTAYVGKHFEWVEATRSNFVGAKHEIEFDMI